MNDRIHLHGNWQVEGAGKRFALAIPGDVHSALLDAGHIEDPYWGTNELDIQHLHGEDWLLTHSVSVDADFLRAPSVYLHFDSIDTVAEVRVNGQIVGQSDNMFTRSRFEIKDHLLSGPNAIEVRIRSAEHVAVERAGQMPYEIPGSDYPVQSPHRNLVRKVQCHAGWDWGCCLMAAGLYGDVYLAAASPGRIEHVYTEQHFTEQACRLEVHVEVLAAQAGSSELVLSIDGQTIRRSVELIKGVNVLAESIEIANPKRWWPAGYGEQPLYELEVVAAGDWVKKRIGLRELALATEEDDRGLSFAFYVNGMALFAKGANWIPCDALPARQTRAVLDDLLSSAVEANMNMIRVWGGGQYESEDFYDLCDEKGLLVWQDFMFSCSTYPATADFLSSVEEEARYQVKRLRDHACIALWCGNNEDLGALNWFSASRDNRDRYLVDYDRLTEGVLGRVVDECDPTRSFWPSSPCGGRGDYSDNWHDDSRGDMHYWQVWHSGKSFDAYYDVAPRFCSEFGYQSFPSMETIKTYAPEDQFNVTAPVMEHHQRNPGGNSKITEMFTRYFRMPDGFANFVYLSQVQQGLAIKTAVEHWRHLRPLCMGVLYWQLNDLWPVCSWSSLEYGGKWKLLHYMAKRFYAPTVVSVFQTEQNDLEVWASNDRLQTVEVQGTVRVFTFEGELEHTVDLSASVEAGSALQLRKMSVDVLAPARAEVFAVLDVAVAGETLRNEHAFVPWKSCDLSKADVQCRVVEREDGQLAVAIKTDAPVFYLTLEAQGLHGEFEDNGFTLLPDEERVLSYFDKKRGISSRELASALRIQHLRSTYA